MIMHFLHDDTKRKTFFFNSSGIVDVFVAMVVLVDLKNSNLIIFWKRLSFFIINKTSVCRIAWRTVQTAEAAAAATDSGSGGSSCR
jgi:hypothetical protein